MTRKETRDITANLPEGIEIVVDRSPVDLGGLEWRLGLGIEDGYIVLTSEGTKEFAKRIHYTQNFILGEEFRVAGEPDGDIVLNINQEVDAEIDPYEVVKEQYYDITQALKEWNGEDDESFGAEMADETFVCARSGETEYMDNGFLVPNLGMVSENHMTKEDWEAWDKQNALHNPDSYSREQLKKWNE